MKKFGFVGGVILLLGGAFYYYWVTTHPFIYTFNQKRDTQPILEIFKQNWNWLVSSDDYDPAFTLKYLAPNNNRRYLGKLNINVLRQGNDLIGFVAYYMKSQDLGFLLFLAVDNRFRRQKYGELLLRYGLQQLTHLGAKKIRLVTRITNIPAQTLYKRVGFYEFSREPEGFIYFEYDPLKITSQVPSQQVLPAS